MPSVLIHWGDLERRLPPLAFSVKTLCRTLAALVSAVTFAVRGYSQETAPAPVTLPPCLIQYDSTYLLYGSSSTLILYSANQTFDVISSVSTSVTTTPNGNVNTTYPPVSGSFTYSVDPQDPTHATIVAEDGVGQPLYFYTTNFGGMIPSGYLPQLGTANWFNLYPQQVTNGGTNVSNRCQLAAGGQAISGFVIQSGGPRWVLLRAVGSTLGNFGVSPTVTKPSITLYNSGQVVGSSSVWSADPNLTPGFSTIFSLVGAFPLNTGSDEGVILLPLNPGAYTAVFNAGSAGTILCEAYILPY